MFNPVITFGREEQISAVSEILETVIRSVFLFFMTEDRPMTDSEIDELLSDSFDIATVAMAVTGMEIVGENINGDYVVKFSPYESMADFAKNHNLESDES